MFNECRSHRFYDHKEYYIDGSKSLAGCGVAFSDLGQQEIIAKVHNDFHNSTLELLALDLCISNLDGSEKVVIYSDSLATLHKLKNDDIDNYVLIDI